MINLFFENIKFVANLQDQIAKADQVIFPTGTSEIHNVERCKLDIAFELSTFFVKSMFTVVVQILIAVSIVN